MEPRVPGIADNFQKPGARVTAAEAREESERAQVGFLDNVVCVLPIPREPAGQGVGSIKMRQDGLLKIRAMIVHKHEPSRGRTVCHTERLRVSLWLAIEPGAMDGRFL